MSNGPGLNVAVLGAGRMGRLVAALIDARDDASVSGVWSRRDGRTVGGTVATSDASEALHGADVAIDFTLPAATDTVVAAVMSAGVPLVCGVSGLEPAQIERLKAAGKKVPVLYDRNMSYGIAVVSELLRRAATAFAQGFATTIHETHHIHKMDAPSGTALMLGEVIADAQNVPFDEVFHYEPESGSVPGRGRSIFRLYARERSPATTGSNLRAAARR